MRLNKKPNKTLDRMTRSAFSRMFHVDRQWRAPRHRSALRSATMHARVSLILLVACLAVGCSSRHSSPNIQDALASALPHDASIEPSNTVSNYSHLLDAEGPGWSVTVRWNPGELTRWVKWQEGKDGFTLVIPLRPRHKPFTYSDDGVTMTRYGPYQPACVHRRDGHDWHVMMSHEQADFPTEGDLTKMLKSSFPGSPHAKPVLSPDGIMVTLRGPSYSNFESVDVEIWLLTVNGRPPSASLLKPFLTGAVKTEPNKGAAANRRHAGQSDGSDSLSAIAAAGRAFPAAFAELDRSVTRNHD